jgi:hypothetical protein
MLATPRPQRKPQSASLTEVVGEEVVESFVSIVSAEDVERVLVDDGRVAFAWTRSHAVAQHQRPLLTGEVELVEVVGGADDRAAASRYRGKVALYHSNIVSLSVHPSRQSIIVPPLGTVSPPNMYSEPLRSAHAWPEPIRGASLGFTQGTVVQDGRPGLLVMLASCYVGL